MIYKWRNDREVLYYSDGPEAEGYDLDTIKNYIFEAGSRSRFCFMMEAEGEVIGECWLQRMNLARLREQYPSKDLRRIDLTIGEKQYWGMGYGTRAIALLTRFGFAEEKADMIFGCCIASYNPRSLKAFQKNGFEMHSKVREEDGGVSYDLCLIKEKYLQIADISR